MSLHGTEPGELGVLNQTFEQKEGKVMPDSNRNTGAGQAEPAPPRTAAIKEVLTEKTRRELNDILGSIKYGSVTLIVQDGKVIQIEKNEKIRLT
jgi:hypothetical protein